MASAVLILFGLSAIFSMNAQSLQILRRTQQTGAATQILQERIETMRQRPWPDVSRSAAVVTWMAQPTNSAPDLADVSPTERLIITPAPSSVTAAATSSASFIVERKNGQARVLKDADLSGERLLAVQASIEWKEQRDLRGRELRTIIGRAGLTRSGIFGSAFGRVGTGMSVSPP